MHAFSPRVESNITITKLKFEPTTPYLTHYTNGVIFLINVLFGKQVKLIPCKGKEERDGGRATVSFV